MLCVLIDLLELPVAFLLLPQARPPSPPPPLRVVVSLRPACVLR
jgi:hypothetical protein